VVSTLALPVRHRDGEGAKDGKIDLGQTLREMAEGWRFIGASPEVRAVIIGLATGLIGGGMVVPLGTLFSTDVLHAGTQGYGLFVTALGTGVAAGVIGLSFVQNRLPKERAFVAALFASGGSLLAGASMGHLGLASVFVAMLGLAAGAVYVLGFTILQTNVDDELRGRTFATLYALIRLCLLLALSIAPLISDLLDRASRHAVGGRATIASFHLALPGVRLTLWLGGLIILGAGVLAHRSLRRRPAV
jgi:dTMP kinase